MKPAIHAFIAGLALACPAAARPAEGTYELRLERPVKELLWVSVFPREGNWWLQVRGREPLRLEPGREGLHITDPGEFGLVENGPVTLRFTRGPGDAPYLAARAGEAAWTGRRTTRALTECAPPRPADATLSVAEMQEDFRRLRQLLLHVHPAPLAFVSRRELDAFLDAQYRLIAQPMSVQAFAAILAPAAARIHCGHTRLGTPEGYWEHFKDGFLPLRVQVDGDRAFAIQACSEAAASRVPAGSELVALDGQPMKSILASLRSTLSTDGENRSAQDTQLDSRFSSLLALFQGTRSSYKVTFRAPGVREERTVALAGEPRSTVVKAADDASLRYGTSQDRRLGFAARPEIRTGILTIRSFGYYRNTDAFKTFVDDAFRRIREGGLETLILDVRDNSGGDPFCSTHLLSYLEPVPVPYFARVYGPAYAPMAQPIPLAANAFKGRLLVLMDGGCFSSTSHLLAILKHHRIGTLIGTEAGGAAACHDGSQPTTLPFSGYRPSIPRLTFAVAADGLPAGRGVLPDEPVRQRADDLARGIDTQLAFALDIAARPPRP